jgi:hypothetical protein
MIFLGRLMCVVMKYFEKKTLVELINDKRIKNIPFSDFVFFFFFFFHIT